MNKLDQDQQNLMDSSAESYWMHMNTWGIDSYDDAGAERITLHNRPDACPNASWNGAYTSYCDGVYFQSATWKALGEHPDRIHAGPTIRPGHRPG